MKRDTAEPASRFSFTARNLTSGSAQNLENPFRNWVDDDEKGGAAACKAYAKALRAIEASPDPQRATEILRSLASALNRVDENRGLIDTLRRGDAWETFKGLATKASINEDDASDWFDEWRDF